MSQRPKKRPPSRRVAGGAQPQAAESAYDEYDAEETYDTYAEEEEYYEEEAPPAPPPRRARRDDYPPAGRARRNDYPPPARTRSGGYARSAPSARPRAVAPRRDYFPYIMGGLIGALVIGLMAAVYLLASNNGSGTAPVSNPGSTTGDTTGSQPTQAPSAGEAPRMTLEEFKALYDDPAKRPIILDVRAKQGYDEGHIKGAISLPEAEVDSRYQELPKDKLIVAYCQ